MNGLQGSDREITGFGIGIDRHIDLDNPTPVVYWKRNGLNYDNYDMVKFGEGALHVEYSGKVFSADEFIDSYYKKEALSDIGVS